MNAIGIALLTWLPQSEPPCGGEIKTHSFPAAMVDVRVGYDFSGYDKADLLVPEPIPVAVRFEDKDKYLAFCGVSCEREELFDSGPLTLNWRLTWGGPTEADLGGFLTPLGTLETEFQGDALLYVPPKTISPGSNIQVTVRGVVWDRCPESNGLNGPNGHSDNSFMDCSGQPWEVAIPVNVGRTLEGKFLVGIPPFDLPQCMIEGPPCQSSSNGCCMLIGGEVGRVSMPTDQNDPKLRTPKAHGG